MMRLQLKRPLCFFDLESTGRFPDRDRIVDITIVKLLPDGHEVELSTLVNPGVPIPASATAVHGITDAMVAGADTFKKLAPTLGEVLRGCDLAGYGIRRFDVPLLCAEFQRAKYSFSMEGRRVVDALGIYHKREPRDLTAALAFFCNDTLDGAHRAAADVVAAMRVFRAQLQRYPDLPATIDALHAYCKDPSWIDDNGKLVWIDGVACIGFGKNAGRPLAEMAATPHDRDWCRWVLSSDFPADTKRIIQDALNGKFPKLAEEASNVAVG